MLACYSFRIVTALALGQQAKQRVSHKRWAAQKGITADAIKDTGGRPHLRGAQQTDDAGRGTMAQGGTTTPGGRKAHAGGRSLQEAREEPLPAVEGGEVGSLLRQPKAPARPAKPPRSRSCHEVDRSEPTRHRTVLNTECFLRGERLCVLVLCGLLLTLNPWIKDSAHGQNRLFKVSLRLLERRCRLHQQRSAPQRIARRPSQHLPCSSSAAATISALYG